MRIVGGRWAGRTLTSPSGRVRPTAEEVRDAWMRKLAGSLPGARVLDLYAGTGALGLEALSRGAESCDFVESSPSSLHALKANVAALRVRACTRIFKRDALEFIHRIRAPYDIAFADPPYGSRQLDRLLDIWMENPFSAILSVEHASNHPLPRPRQILRLGDTAVSIYETALATASPAGGIHGD